jgi:hypothetical protein
MFWLQTLNPNLEILLDSQRLTEFVPTSSMNLDEKLNATSRFLLYLGLLMVIATHNVNFFFVTLIGFAVLYLVSQNHPHQIGGDKQVDFQQPSAENPFMNVLLSDNKQRPPAADIEDPFVKEQMEKHFSQGLYRNVDDIWDRNNSQRQFYSTPSTTIPNDQDAFARWCYSTPYTCKDGNLSRCLKYEDVRAHGQIY